MNWNGARLLSVAFAFFAGISAIMPPVTSEFIEYIPLWGPLEVVRSYNRWVCMGFGVVILSASLALYRSRSREEVPAVLGLLAGLHLVIFLKNFFADPMQAAQLLGGIAAMLSALWFFSRMRVSSARSPHEIWEPIIWASFGFLGINLLQYAINPAATMILGGRFNGVTSNPQMFALSTAVVVPTLLFEYNHPRRTLPRWIVLICFLALAFMVIQTGSRLALLLSAFSVLMFYRLRIGQFAAFILPLIGLALVSTMISEAPLMAEDARILSTENTRGDVWVALWSKLLQYPLFGAPLPPGGRVGFGESSYLGPAAAIGVMGLVLTVAVALWVGRVIVRLMDVERRNGWNPLTALPLAILSTSLLGSLFEASLVGTFTFPVIMMLYAAISSRLLLVRLEKSNRRPGGRKGKRTGRSARQKRQGPPIISGASDAEPSASK